jgi:hypothetical protein
MPTTTTRDKLPMQTMPTDTSMSSLTQVQCLTTPVSVTRKTATRQINIEEYAGSSSETEEMPLDKTYRRVRLNAPLAPVSTPLGTTYYLREDFPYYLDVE